MIIKDTIDGLLDSLPDPLPNLLGPDHAALVQSCLISLKELSQKTRWRMLMRLTSENTTLGVKTMLEYLEAADDIHCMASAAHDLKLYRDRLPFG
ncbi:hypothetical protein AB3662_39665 [Sorangium cellulosum]|uniref:hypothetical protein n=1 Tax=Sorangium cellulosum TaxID=56 RepID=UPI003D9A4FD3